MFPSGYGITNAATQMGLREFATPGCSDLSDYQLGKQIGNGAYALVKEAIHKPTGERVAIKVYDRFKLMDIQRKKSALREIKILSKLNHP
jgi:serine/threonine protein kinase